MTQKMTSSDLMDKIITNRIDTAGKVEGGRRGMKGFLLIYPLPVFLFFSFLLPVGITVN